MICSILNTLVRLPRIFNVSTTVARKWGFKLQGSMLDCAGFGEMIPVGV